MTAVQIGIFGGSFNPVHHHHLTIASRAREALGLDEVRLVPVFLPVHKDDRGLAPFASRERMLRRSIENRPGLVVDPIEAEIGGPSYTIRTIEELRHRHPQARFTVIIGEDSLADLPTWHEIDRLFALARFAVARRPGYDAPPLFRGAPVQRLDVAPDPAAARDLRESLRHGRFAGLPIPGGALGEIVAEGLYGCWTPIVGAMISELRTALENLPTDIRAHCEGAARLAARFAAEEGIDPRLGAIAGLAHDLCRGLERGPLQARLNAARVDLRPFERDTVELWHGPAAAGELARRWLRDAAARIAAAGNLELLIAELLTVEPGGSDLDEPAIGRILRAIRGHTTTEGAVDGLVRAVVMADVLEYSRGGDGRRRWRADDVTPERRWREVLRRKIASATAGGHPLAPPLIEAWQQAARQTLARDPASAEQHDPESGRCHGVRLQTEAGGQPVGTAAPVARRATPVPPRIAERPATDPTDNGRPAPENGEPA